MGTRVSTATTHRSGTTATGHASVPVERKISATEATALVGTMVEDQPGNVLPSPADHDSRVTVVDADTAEPLVIITRLDPGTVARVRQAVLTVGMGTVARMGARMPGGGRTFGYSPRKVVAQKESCGEASMGHEHPGPARVLAELAGTFGRQFAAMLPEQAAADRDVLGQVNDDWLLADDALWTSGVINRTATLPYHRDGANFHTWSAMPTLRMGMNGGRLHIPEYGITCPARDGEVTWFCGRDLVHGVTPMRQRRTDGYRFSIVYYALQGMKDCATYAEETTSAAAKRTARERQIAENLRAAMKASSNA